MGELRTNVLIVGGGAAGISAAVAAADNAAVTIIDDNPFLGGQIWRAEMGKVKSPGAVKLIDQVKDGRVKIVSSVTVFGHEHGKRLLAESPEGRLELSYEKLIIATGARERFLPFPGWTLPGVYGAGGLQAMVKGGMDVHGKSIVIAGTGPLLLAVADYLKAKGANVIAIAEQAPASRLKHFALGLWRSPGKLARAAALRTRLRGVPYYTDCWVTSAAGKNKVEQVTLTRKSRPWSLDCDFLACGFHLVPNIELPSLLGCTIENGFVAVDRFQQTSLSDVYCAGEPTGIGGVEASLVEGKIAGLAAVGRKDAAEALFAKREKSRRFAEALNAAFSLRDELKTLADDCTVVCRCGDVEYGRLTEFTSFRDAKLMTRCGMGPCQGRICGAATEFLFDWEQHFVRPPIFPVKMENL